MQILFRGKESVHVIDGEMDRELRLLETITNLDDKL